ncbi:Protein of unknown function [Capnocytophaga haemolytica]|uniref:Protein of uncharacterized function (DUF1351) n=2 Tax=Capnocytophaga haemolytica TaxID=45243 RepID=A0AAX2GW02_9FLAO|nr:DUF1351 domain-containing protein [Capnocytophaga haemolytica]SFN68517.1 Protein of unknown function [Capnocytophaga haemolytica]SNV05085.1 Protein of uncharacterised function (DUF1351) [Capnocytophaga haemolytica]
MKEIITLQQAPIILYNMQEYAKDLAARIASAEIETAIVTDENINTVKKVRAAFTKEFKAIDAKRLQVERELTAPWKELMEQYNTLVKSQYDDFDKVCKEKVFAHEAGKKNEKELNVKAYFDELCAAKGIDFLPFKSLGLNITLSEAVSKLKERVRATVEGVTNDLELINNVPESDEYKSEVLAEYKCTLSTAGAFKAVNERRDARAAELKRLEAQKQSAPVAPVQAQPQAPILQAPTMATSAPIAPVQAQIQRTPHRLLFDMLCTDEQADELANIVKQYLKTNNIQIL